MQTPDFRRYLLDPAVTAAEINGNVVQVTWADGEQARFHSIWLRDNAADAGSIDPHSRERTYDFLSIPLDISPAAVGVGPSGSLAVSWTEGAEPTLYHPGWLRAYSYDLGARDRKCVERQTWDASQQDNLPNFAYSEVIEDAATRLDWLRTIQRVGIAILHGDPAQQADHFEPWLNTLWVLRDMNWGKYYDVIYEPDGEYIANKGIEIVPHLDGPTREYMPGLQVFRCLKNSVDGGDSYWVDGFHVVEKLRRKYPDDFQLLSTTPWAMANRNADTEYKHVAPIICLDINGAVSEVRDTHWLREPLLTDFDRVEPLYRAYRRYTELIRDPANWICRRLQPGDIAVIDNRRVLHARSAYLGNNGERHMRIIHAEREELDSSIRVLERQFATERQ